MPSKVVGGPVKIHCTEGRFHGNPVSRNQSRSWPPTGTVALKELEWRNLPNIYLINAGGSETGSTVALIF